MPPDALNPGSPEHWIQYARADLALARVPLPCGGLYELLCYHAQQAAEKSVKAVLIRCGIEPPRIHNLQRLIDLLPASMLRTADLALAPRLTVYATAARYPADEEPVTESEYQEAVRLAEAVVAWAEGIIYGAGE